MTVWRARRGGVGEESSEKGGRRQATGARRPNRVARLVSRGAGCYGSNQFGMGRPGGGGAARSSPSLSRAPSLSRLRSVFYNKIIK